MDVSDELRADIRFRALELALGQGYAFSDPVQLTEVVDTYEAIVLPGGEGAGSDDDAAGQPGDKAEGSKSGNPKGGK